MKDLDSAAVPAPGLPAPDPRLACAWPRLARPVHARIITAGELKNWILHEDGEVLVVNKPGDVVCHPSKAGPWSSLAGAVREYSGLAVSHLVYRLDRETSGVVVFAKNTKTAARLQKALRLRQVGKVYLAIMTGELPGPVTVDQPLGDDAASPVLAKAAVRADGRQALTHFMPLSRGGGFTLARVVTGTGRKHQIRAHAQWLGYGLVGDKIYGPDAGCFLEFIEHGWSADLEAKLLMPRQALHCSEIDMREAGADRVYRAALPADMLAFCAARGLAVPK